MLRKVCIVMLIIAGSNLLTFANTRYQTSRMVGTQAQKYVAEYLEQNQLPTSRSSVEGSEMPILVRVAWAGGEKFGYNQMLPYQSAGMICLAGALLLFCMPLLVAQKRRQSDS
ncbi:MAG: hypothetical protein HJJLKODD_02253 [Phycisphaerae bacterium]|nr:hypothetical protein [Phycisphaerae bacterium]